MKRLLLTATLLASALALGACQREAKDGITEISGKMFVFNYRIATATYIPAGKVHSQGVELEAHHQITPQLSTIASYTWNRLRFQDTKDGTDNNTPQLTPDQMASFWARYQFPAGISVGAGVRYIGKQWADDANTARLPSVTLMDAMMRADLGVWSPTLKGAYVQVNANNIGDREYISGCYGTGNCYWGAERSVIATVGYDF